MMPVYDFLGLGTSDMSVFKQIGHKDSFGAVFIYGRRKKMKIESISLKSYGTNRACIQINGGKLPYGWTQKVVHHIGDKNINYNENA